MIEHQSKIQRGLQLDRDNKGKIKTKKNLYVTKF
jgi:hypothetical protein